MGKIKRIFFIGVKIWTQAENYKNMNLSLTNVLKILPSNRVMVNKLVLPQNY